MRRKKIIEEILCDKCGKKVDSFYVKISKDKKDYHPECYGELYTPCGDCDEDFPNDQIVYDSYTDRGLCKNCVKDRYEYYKDLFEKG